MISMSYIIYYTDLLNITHKLVLFTIGKELPYFIQPLEEIWECKLVVFDVWPQRVGSLVILLLQNLISECINLQGTPLPLPITLTVILVSETRSDICSYGVEPCMTWILRCLCCIPLQPSLKGIWFSLSCN